MRRLGAFLGAVLLLCSIALAQTGKAPVRDATALLSDQTVTEAAELISKVQADTGVKLVVELRHFLGGADVNSKARELLNEEQDPEYSLLLLAAVGEDSYALAAGKAAQALLNKDAQDNLLSMSFRQPFLSRAYDQALASFLRQAGERLAVASGKPSSVGGLLKEPVPTKQPEKRYTINFPLNIGHETRPTPRTPEAVKSQEQGKDKGMSFFSVVAISYVLYAIFGKKRGKQRGGCGPIGWILGGLGLSKIFGWRK